MTWRTHPLYAIGLLLLILIGGIVALVVPVSLMFGWITAPPFALDVSVAVRWVALLVALIAAYQLASSLYQAIVVATLDVSAAVQAAWSLAFYLVFLVAVVAFEAVGGLSLVLFTVLTVWLVWGATGLFGRTAAAVGLVAALFLWVVAIGAIANGMLS